MKIEDVICSNEFMLAYGVCNLFISITLKETMGIAVELIFDKYPDLKIGKEELKQLLETSRTHFVFDSYFDSYYYYLIDGVAMGPPLGPVLANLFMSFHEKRQLGQFQFCYVLLYCSYVNGIMCLFNFEQDMDDFF